MGAFQKLKLLIWKNFLLQKRHKFQTIFEIASPVIFSLFLILIRCLVDPVAKPDIAYASFSPTFYNVSDSRIDKNLTDVKKKGTLAFSPEGPLPRKALVDALEMVALDNLSGILALLFDPSMLPTPKGYKNAKEMEVELSRPDAMKLILVGVQFDDNMANASKWPADVVITLRFPATMRTPMVDNPIKLSWRTNLLYPLFPKPGPREPDDMHGGKLPGYSPEMFLAVQHAVSHAVLKTKLGKSVGTRVLMQRFPQLAYREDKLLIALEKFISMIIMLCFAYTFVNTVRVVTYEKELQLKETMMIMGLPSWLHWLAWFIKQFSFLLISAVLMVILFKIPFNSTSSGDKFSVLTFTPSSVLFFFMMLFIIVSLAFCFMVSVFFTRANTAAAFMGLAWFATYSVFMLTQVVYEDTTLATKIALCLISNAAMGFAFQMLVICEGNGKGLQWGEFFKPISYHDDFMPGHVIAMMIFDTVLYMLVAMYVEKIRPGLYGVPMPWYFPFTKRFWRSEKVADISHAKRVSDEGYQEALLKVVHDEEPQGVNMSVNIQNLTKVYKGTRKAVDNLNLRMYENEITVLLGHNGAGKTTTISMLTGTVPPTSGTATINGHDVVKKTELARKSIGICPQHNVLFPDLTVAEHLKFFSRLKGVPSEKLDAEVKHFVKLLKLEEKSNVESSELSGGQKRRLSVGTAMCGSSRVVLLDEPTSGLDPAARRALWDLLLSEKKGRTMILTTHFMDEADVLGDRIAIMAGGKLQCVGTPYFLKKHYGVGYKLTIVKENECKVDDVTFFLKQYVPDLKENTNIGSELTYILPKEHVSKFPDLLKNFESMKESLYVSSYGLSITSLEEVFMKAGAEDNGEASPDEANEPKSAQSENHAANRAVVPLENNKTFNFNSGPLENVKGFSLLKNHIKAMFLKLFHNSIRNKLVAFIQLISPIINIALSVVIARSWNFLSTLPPLILSLKSGFKNSQTLISHYPNLTDDSIENKTLKSYTHYFNTTNYPGMSYLDIKTLDMGKTYLKLSSMDPDRVKFENVIGATFGPQVITCWFSNNGYHDSAISLAHVNDAISRAVLPGSSLTVVNYPLPYSIESLLRVMATGGTMGFQFAFNMGFCMAFVSSFIVLFAIKERISGAKLLQRVSGLRPAVMWVTALIWDWTWLFLVHVCIIVTLACFQENTLKTPGELGALPYNERDFNADIGTEGNLFPETYNLDLFKSRVNRHFLGRVFLILSVLSLAIIPLHYIAALLFDSSATGFAKMCFINIFSGCMPFLITEVLRLPGVGNAYYANLFDWIFSIMPLYCLCRSLRDMSVSSFAVLACDALCDQFVNIANCSRYTLCNRMRINVCCFDDNPYMNWSEPGIGRYLFMMNAVGALSFSILLLLEYNIISKYLYSAPQGQLPNLPTDEDSDVTFERDYVKTLALDRYSLVCRDLTKHFRKFLAVNRLSFVVHKAQCFGLLGINGAGKTTTFRMLTGDEHISGGDAFVHGLSIKTELQQVYRRIGYCPQFDALLDNLTARENLRIFCLLRGIPADIGTSLALQLAASLGFERHFDKQVNQCSGGTKRKISTAVALLGDAPLVFLDEPTTGMDPASKRLVWSSITQAVAEGRSVVLTSHSMEECEALCSRLTVMVAGRLCCLGSLQHLKSKFSQGYTVIVNCKSGAERDVNVANVNAFVFEKFSNATLIESYLGINTYFLNDPTIPWWKIFYVMEEMRFSLPIEDYAVTQTSLEQVFLRFTRMQSRSED